MIKANELRIGNWVNETVIGNCEILGIELHGSGQTIIHVARVGAEFKNKVDVVNIDPIPLTPEILEKAGFQKLVKEEWELNEGETVINDYELETTTGSIYVSFGMTHYEKGGYVYSGLGGPDSYGYKIDIKYVHQLQNLYFALTGEELNINL